MTILQYLSAFRLFGGDVLVLGFAVTVAVSVLKKTALRNASKKLFVFAPFVLGTLLFAAYRCLATLSAAPLTDDIAATFEGGFACGCAATLYYVVYEQFLRAKQSAAGGTAAAQSEDTAAVAADKDMVPASAAAAADMVPASTAADADMVPASTAAGTDSASADGSDVAALLEPFASAADVSEAAAALLGAHETMDSSTFSVFLSETLARFLPTLDAAAREALAKLIGARLTAAQK